MASYDPYIIVYRTYDPFQADIIGDLLRENGIAARVIGTRSGAAIGVGQVILQQHVEVPRAQAGQAADFIEDFVSVDGEQLLRDAGLEVDDEPAISSAPAEEIGPRSAVITAGMSLLTTLFAGGHFYAQRHWTGAFLLAGQLIALGAVVSGGATGDLDAIGAGLVMFAVIRVFDLIGAQLAARAFNRGVRTSTLRQWVIGGIAVAAAGALGQALGPHVPLPNTQQAAPQQAPQPPSVPGFGH